uniref:Putative ovule protein n=1 Tax=Solanum chacoense TaxID=4108 RepID=A0A0V0IFM9_SOLCH
MLLACDVLQWWPCYLIIICVTIDKEIRAILSTSMVIGISEPPIWTTKITISHSICHLICCEIPSYLHGRKKAHSVNYKIFNKESSSALQY